MKGKLVVRIIRILQCMVSTLIIMMLIMNFIAPYAANAASVSVTRDLPDTVSLNETFEVTITFTASEDNFTPAIIDVASEDWQVQVDTSWCTPAASESNITEGGIRAEYIWYNSVSAGTQFTVLYRVTVPGNAAEGIYTFSGGKLGYKIAGGATQFVNITGKSMVLIKNGSTEGSPTTPGEPVDSNAPEEAGPANNINTVDETNGIDNSIKGEVAETQGKSHVPGPDRSGGQGITPGPASSKSTLLYPPASQSEPINWPALCGIAGGVVIIVLFCLFLFRRRTN